MLLVTPNRFASIQKTNACRFGQEKSQQSFWEAMQEQIEASEKFYQSNNALSFDNTHQLVKDRFIMIKYFIHQQSRHLEKTTRELEREGTFFTLNEAKLKSALLTAFSHQFIRLQGAMDDAQKRFTPNNLNYRMMQTQLYEAVQKVGQQFKDEFTGARDNFLKD